MAEKNVSKRIVDLLHSTRKEMRPGEIAKKLGISKMRVIGLVNTWLKPKFVKVRREPRKDGGFAFYRLTDNQNQIDFIEKWINSPDKE